MDKEHRREEELRNYAYHLESSNYDADDEVAYEISRISNRYYRFPTIYL